MILADTSIWVDHLRATDPNLQGLLREGEILMHPFIVGEIALGYLPRRDEVLRGLLQLPQVAPATDEEVLLIINTRALFGRGIGYVDAHLLAAVRLTPETQFWTRDRRLHSVSIEIGVAAPMFRH